MKFTKEYIKEANCREIQGLHKRTYYDKCVYHNRKYIWLPTGDQLDEEIVKICRENNYDLQIRYDKENQDYDDLMWTIIVYGMHRNEYADICECVIPLACFVNDNPLIAKIKLLKQLLKEK